MADETTTRPNARKLREGIVTSAGMEKTAVVTVTTRKPHPLYKKTMVRTKKLYVHYEANDAKVGDKVRVQETRPLSKLKRWRLVEVLERARMIQQEIAPSGGRQQRGQGGPVHPRARRHEASLRQHR